MGLPQTPIESRLIIPGARTTPWRHQEEAVEFVRALYSSGHRGAMICADMGTGKTAMAVYTALLHGFREIVVVGPLRVVQVWKPQIELHSAVPFVVGPLDGAFPSVSAKRAEAERLMKLARARGAPLAIIVNFESAWRSPFAEWALRQRWDLMVIDEIHRAKAPGGKASRFLARLGKVARYRLGMTGTPMVHGPTDVYGQLRAIAPSVFGWSFTAFRQRYAIMGGFQNHQVVGYRNLDELHRKFFSVAFRVTKDVLDLPEELEVTYPCELGAQARRIYLALKKDLIADVGSGAVTAANALVRLLRFAQLTGGFIRTDEGEQIQIDTAKMELLRDVLEDLDPTEPVVVFARFRNDLDVVHRVAADLGRGSFEISGRRDELRDWQSGAAPILAAQIQAGGVGIDLTRSRYAIYYSIGFSLGDFLQSKARLHRPGQRRTTEFIFLAAANTVDEQILRALAARQDLVESVLAQTIGTAGNGPVRSRPQRNG
jgi:SNF2 family DNA or RNA helicase